MPNGTDGLQESLDGFEAGCKDLGLGIAQGVRRHIERMFKRSFAENRPFFGEAGPLVIAAGRFAGQYAAAYAILKDSDLVEKTHANRGLAEAKKLCTAGARQKPERREWCRGVKIPEDPIVPEPR